MAKTISLGKRIRELRKERNITQEELAQRIRGRSPSSPTLDQSTISKMETEKNGVIDSAQLLDLANAFLMPGLEIVKGTSGEEFASRFLLRRFCANHSLVYIIDRLQDGFENRFCYDCGQKLKGDCQHCGTPIQALSVVVDAAGFCHVCGTYIDLFREGEEPSAEENPKYEQLKWQYQDLSTDTALERKEYIGPGRLCLTPHEDMRQFLPDEDPETEPELEKDGISQRLVFPKFSLTGEVKYCPECGRETIDACPSCGRPILKLASGYVLNFCAGCGLNFREFRPEADADSSGEE